MFQWVFFVAARAVPKHMSRARRCKRLVSIYKEECFSLVVMSDNNLVQGLHRARVVVCFVVHFAKASKPWPETMEALSPPVTKEFRARNNPYVITVFRRPSRIQVVLLALFLGRISACL